MTQYLTVAEVSSMVGISPTHLRRLIADNDLKAISLPFRQRSRWMIHRDALVKWLISAGWPAAKIRQMFPQDGTLATLALRDPLRQALSMERPRNFDRLLDLVVEMSAPRPWGIVFDLPHYSTSLVIRELTNFAKTVDRPVLIAIHGEDTEPREELDFWICETLPPGKIAQRIRALRPWK